MRHLVAVNQGVRYFWPCRTFEPGLQSVWGLVCLQLTFTLRLQSFSISTQRAGSIPGSFYLCRPWTSTRLLYPVKLSKACISHQERNAASRIKNCWMPLLYQYCYNLKAAKIRTVNYSETARNQKSQLILWTPEPQMCRHAGDGFHEWMPCATSPALSTVKASDQSPAALATTPAEAPKSSQLGLPAGAAETWRLCSNSVRLDWKWKW